MDDTAADQIPDPLFLVWAKAFENKRFHDALAIAFANCLVARETKNEEFEQSSLTVLRGAIDGLLPPDDPANKHECSFCGRSPPDVRLAAGPNVFICDGCVTMLAEDVFSAPA